MWRDISPLFHSGGDETPTLKKSLSSSLITSPLPSPSPLLPAATHSTSLFSTASAVASPFSSSSSSISSSSYSSSILKASTGVTAGVTSPILILDEPTPSQRDSEDVRQHRLLILQSPQNHLRGTKGGGDHSPQKEKKQSNKAEDVEVVTKSKEKSNSPTKRMEVFTLSFSLSFHSNVS